MSHRDEMSGPQSRVPLPLPDAKLELEDMVRDLEEAYTANSDPDARRAAARRLLAADMARELITKAEIEESRRALPVAVERRGRALPGTALAVLQSPPPRFAESRLVDLLVDALGWVANTVHQAHHTAGEWRQCETGICVTAQRAIESVGGGARADLVHYLVAGNAICGFSSERPERWPEGHSFSSRSTQVTCPRCKELQR